MLRLLRAVLVALIAAVAAGSLVHAQPATDPENTLFLETTYGRVVIAMRPDLAPKHVVRIKELVRAKFYDGLVFHRVIDGFMAQTGDPKGNGTGGSGTTLPAEFTREPFVRGTVGMARGQTPNTGDSQFFIMFTSYPSLNNQYTVWGRVISGMDSIDKIKKGEPPAQPDRILTMRVAADVK